MGVKVSVIVPVYGVEKYIERCVRSLFEQTLDDIEYIFVDDCSPDNSIAILNDIIEKYPNRKAHTKVIRLQKNCGLPTARKEGINVASGEFIIHCDSDDWVDVTMYEDLYNKAIEGNHDIVICDYFISKTLEDNLHITQDIKPLSSQLLHDLLSEKIHGAVWNKLVKRNLYENDIIYPTCNLIEDMALMIQLVYYSQSIGYINRPYYHYFYNTCSITQQNLSVDKSIERGLQAIRNCELMQNFFSRQSNLKEFETELICMKITLKNRVASMTSTKEGRVRWMQIFPDLSIIKVVTSGSSLRVKFVYIITWLRLYNILSKLYGRYNKY